MHFPTSRVFIPKMKLAFAIAIVTIINVSLIESAVSDDTLGVLFYEELGCKAENRFFPKYVCPKYKYSDGVCLSKGVAYRDGEIINATSRCNSCYCSSSQNKTGKIICSRPKCSQFIVQKPCWEHYDLDECCPKKSFCPHALMQKCKVGDVLYNEGQYIRPRNTCWECVCQKGFKLYHKDFCRRMRCDLEVNHYDKLVRRCIPLYKTDAKDKALCCPTDFICAEYITSMEMAEMSFLKRLKHFLLKLFGRAVYCEVGDDSVMVGEEFKLNLQENKFRQIHCTCKTPPFPLCVEH